MANITYTPLKGMEIQIEVDENEKYRAIAYVDWANRPSSSEAQQLLLGFEMGVVYTTLKDKEGNEIETVEVLLAPDTKQDLENIAATLDGDDEDDDGGDDTPSVRVWRMGYHSYYDVVEYDIENRRVVVTPRDWVTMKDFRRALKEMTTDDFILEDKSGSKIVKFRLEWVI